MAYPKKIFASSNFLCAILACCCFSGCGKVDDEGRLAISGTVTYDGQPVTSGNIGFIAAKDGAGEPAGTDIVDGHYEIPRSEGPREGSYKIMIYADRPSGRTIAADEGSSETMSQMEQYIPAIYNTRTTLMVDLSEDRDDMNFVLKKPKRSRRRRR